MSTGAVDVHINIVNTNRSEHSVEAYSGKGLVVLELPANLDARIENVMQFEKFKAKAKETFANLPAFTAWAKPKP